MHDIKRQLRKIFDDMEFKRVEIIINTILRDRAIRKEFHRLKNEIGSYKAIGKLAERYFLSVEQVKYIVYNKGQNRI